jgi:prepilin-type N-terminal cleavage/methylation domain-containing protein
MTYKTRQKGLMRGFTIMEVLIVIAIISITAVMSTPFLSMTLSRSELDIAAEGAVDSLEEARSSALNGRSGGQFGVHFEPDQYVLFEGAAYSVADPDNFVHTLSGFVSVSDVNISGGGNDIIFASVSGEPDQTGTIEFTDSSGATKTVTVNSAGTVDF